jgi:hypothetical protein
MSFHPPVPKPRPSGKKPAPRKTAAKRPAKTTSSVKKPC